MDLNDALARSAALVPFVIALVEVGKRTAKLPDRFAPVVALAIGVLAAFLIAPVMPWRDEVLSGVLAGLASCGLWSGTKAVAGK